MTNEELEKVGYEVIELIKRRKFGEIGSVYGYAVRIGREAEAAIKSDFDVAVTECVGSIDNAKSSISISHFKPNETGLESLIECNFLLENSFLDYMGRKTNIYYHFLVLLL